MGREDKLPKEVQKLVEMIAKLEPQEFIGVCKILGVEIYTLELTSNEQVLAAGSPGDGTPEGTGDTEEGTGAKPVQMTLTQNINIKDAGDLIQEVIEKITKLNRTQRRNLAKLLKPATKGR